MQEMDERDPLTKYRYIAKEIRLKILSGFYKENTLLPSSKKLCEMYQVSRLTMRKALNLLENEGYIYIKTGKGAFVQNRSRLNYTVNLEINHILKVPYEKVRLVKAELIEPDIDLVYELKVSRGIKLIYMEWEILANDRVIGYNFRYIPYFKGIPIDEKDLKYMSLKEMLHDMNMTFRESVKIKGIDPDEKLKRKLCTQKDSQEAVILIERKLFDDQNVAYGYDLLYLYAHTAQIKGESFI